MTSFGPVGPTPMFPKDEFLKYAVKHRGISSTTLPGYTPALTPYII